MAKKDGILPTHVGMAPDLRMGRRPRRHSPHARGDGPLSIPELAKATKFSPRTWGWHVFDLGR